MKKTRSELDNLVYPIIKGLDRNLILKWLQKYKVKTFDKLTTEQLEEFYKEHTDGTGH